MKLTCPASFPVDAPQQSGAVYATPLTGERNEGSVLFSLAALAKQAPAPPPPQVTESSALIDILNLSGGGAFAPLFAPPVTYVPAENEQAARPRQRPIVIGAMAVALVAMVGIAALLGVRSRSRAPAVAAATAASPVNAPAEVPSLAGPPPSETVATVASEAPPASSARLAAVTPVRTGPPRPAAPVGTVSTASTTSAAPKCCPGESEMACHMRMSAGAPCGAEQAGSTLTPAAPFDRAAAARALGISMASCKRGEGLAGAGHAKVTFQPSGKVSAVELDAPYAGTATGACVAQRYRGTSVPAFTGGPLSVGKSFVIE